jgi:hypothetical protein
VRRREEVYLNRLESLRRRVSSAEAEAFFTPSRSVKRV